MNPSESLRQIRLIVLSSIGVLSALLVVLPTLGPGFTARAEILFIAIPAAIGLAVIFLLSAVGSSVRPLPAGMSATDAGRVSAGVLRTLLFLRLAMAETPALVGFALSFAADSALPYLVAYLFSVGLLITLVYPREGIIAPIRATLESAGTSSGL